MHPCLRPDPGGRGATWTRGRCQGSRWGPRGLPSPRPPPSSLRCATPFQMLSLGKARAEGGWPWAAGRHTPADQHPASRVQGVSRAPPGIWLPGCSWGQGEEQVPSRAAPAPDPGASALAAECRPRRREECSRVISSEAEKRLRSGPSRPPRVGPASSRGLGSSGLRGGSATWPGSRKTAWASGLPGASSLWYTRILRPAGGVRAQAGDRGALSHLLSAAALGP